MNIINVFLNSVDSFPNKTAIIDSKQNITFSELKKEATKTASYFKHQGVQKGDRILVFVPLSVDLYRIVLAIFYLGATAVFLDEWSNKKRLENCCQIANCNAFVGGWKSQIIRFISKPLRSIPINLSSKQLLKKDLLPIKVKADHSALITFTTGSTGTPKAADRTHGFLLEQYDALLKELKPKPTDITMTNLPIVLLLNLGVGCTSVIPDFNPRKPERLNPNLILKQINDTQTSRIISSPFAIKKLAQHIIDNQLNIQQLKEIFTGGAPVFPTEALIYKKAFPHVFTKIIFGSTEVEPISSISCNDLINQSNKLEKGLPVGDIFSKTNLRIIPIDSTETALAPYELGEIIVSGAHVLDRYYNSPEAFTKNKISIDNTLWHKTGDSGYRIENQLFLTGRCQQLIKHNDEWISPFVVEHKIQQIDGIEIGTIIKQKDQMILVVESKLSLDKLKKRTQEIKYDHIKKVSKIPRDPRHYSKIDYNKLKSIIK